MLKGSTSSTFVVGLLVQVKHRAHLVDLTASITGDSIIVADHKVAEILVKRFGLWQQEAQAQLKKTFWLQVFQPKSLGHDVFQPPVGLLFLVGLRQIQVVLPDILQRDRKAQKETKEERKSL